MDKKYTVFLSSTYDDLKEERNEVIHALLELNCIPCGMEYFPSDDDKQFEFIKSVIDECDFFVLIIAGRYGTISNSGKSYTEMEYRYAIKKGIPVLTFIHDEIGTISLGKSEKNEQNRNKLEAFIKYVSDGKLVKYWNGKEDLAGKVSRTMISAIERHPVAGWIKGTPLLQEIASAYDKNDPSLANELVEIASKCKEQNNFKQAHLFLKWGYLLCPENENVLREYGGLYYDEKNYVQALVYWEKLLSLRESCGHYYLCALAYYLLGKYTEAKEYCYPALKFPDDGYHGRATELSKKL